MIRAHQKGGFFIIILFLLGASAGADVATTQKDYTQHDFVRSTHAYNRRTLVEPYKQIGKRDPKWDDDAVKFLETVCVHFSNASDSSMYRIGPKVDPEELIKQGTAVLEKGCDDPAVAYCRAAVLWDLHHTDEARPEIERAARELMVSGYPINRAMGASRRVFELAHGGPVKEQAWVRYRDCVLAILSTWEFTDVDQRIFWSYINSKMEMDPIEKQQDLLESAQSLKSAEPWLLHMITGRYHINAAWAARGGGWANSVTEEGWRGFFDHLTKARDAYVAAHKLRPRWPEAATDMITVAMGGSDQLNESTRVWLDRALGAQPDWGAAFHSYFYSSLPKWGGSYPQMIALGVACAQSDRYDTIVPWQYVSAVQKICEDSGSYSYYAVPGVYEKINEICEKYAKRAAAPEDKDWYRSYTAALAWRIGRYAEARKTLDAVGDNLDEDCFWRLMTLPKLAISHAYLMSGEHAEVVKAAEASVQTQKFDDALNKYKEIVAKTPEKDRSRQFVVSRHRQLEWMKKFDAGEWVDIQPDEKLTGWYPIQGTWTCGADRALAARGEGWGLECLNACTLFGRRWEIKATIEWPDDPKIVPAAAGILVCGADTSRWWGVWLKKKDNQFCIVNDLHNGEEVETKADPKTNTVTVRTWDNSFTAFVNDHEVATMNQLGDYLQGPKTYIGIGGRTNPNGAQVKIKDIKIHKLSE